MGAGHQESSQFLLAHFKIQIAPRGKFMSLQTSGLDCFTERLENLEKQNHNLKRLFLGTILLFGAVLLMGQATQNKVVEAQKFVLKDVNGKVRAQLAADGKFTTFQMNDALEEKRIELDSDATGSSLVLLPSPKKFPQQVFLICDSVLGSALTMNGLNWGSSVALEATKDEARLRVIDKGKFETTVGNAKLTTPRTGESLKTSAASIVMTDNANKVIWRAP